MTFLEKVAIEAAKMQQQKQRKKKKDKTVNKPSKWYKAKKAREPKKARKAAKPTPATKPMTFDKSAKSATAQGTAFKATNFPMFKSNGLAALKNALAKTKVTKFEEGGEGWGQVYYNAAPEIMFWIMLDLGLVSRDDKSTAIYAFKKQTKAA